MAIQSIERAITILQLFSYTKPRWGITEMASAMALPKGTTHNIVHTLEQGGFLTQDEETRKYQLGPNLFALGTIMAGTLEINRKASAPAHRLAVRTGLTCRVAVWDRDAALVTLDIDPKQSEGLSPRIGPRVLAYCSAIGRALLADFTEEEFESYLNRTQRVAFTPHTLTEKDQLHKEMERTRSRGYAVNNQELALGRASIAATILGHGGRLSASISLTGSPNRVLGKKVDSLAESLRYAAAEISRHMGFYPGSVEDAVKAIR
jgi:DNA-binding IclR family transcriptional regulator